MPSINFDVIDEDFSVICMTFRHNYYWNYQIEDIFVAYEGLFGLHYQNLFCKILNIILIITTDKSIDATIVTHYGLVTPYSDIDPEQQRMIFTCTYHGTCHLNLSLQREWCTLQMCNSVHRLLCHWYKNIDKGIVYAAAIVGSGKYLHT